jgi:hypothetical protein
MPNFWCLEVKFEKKITVQGVIEAPQSQALKCQLFENRFPRLMLMSFNPPLPAQFLPFLTDIALLVILLFIGIVIIVLIAKVLLFVLPAAIIAVVVWFLTGSLFLAGVAFLIIAFISVVRR